MPLFEYACKECTKQFEVLVRASETPECPSCHSTSLERKLSTFAAHTGGAAAPVSAHIIIVYSPGTPWSHSAHNSI